MLFLLSAHGLQYVSACCEPSQGEAGKQALDICLLIKLWVFAC